MRAKESEIDLGVPGMPVEKLGRNSASKNRDGEGSKKNRRSAEIPARQNSHVIPRVEFDDGVAVSTLSRRPPGSDCYIRDWQLSTSATDVRSTDGSSPNRAPNAYTRPPESIDALTNHDCTCEIIDPRAVPAT